MKKKIYYNIFMTLLIIIFIGSIYVLFLIQEYWKITQEYLYEISKKEANIVNEQIVGDLKILNLIKSVAEKEKDIYKIKNIIYENNLENNFYEIIIYFNNQYNTINNKGIEMEILEQIDITNTISKEIKIEDKNYYGYKVPIIEQEQEIGNIFAIKNSNLITKIIDTNIFNGQGYSQITTNTGEIVIRSKHSNSNKIVDNIFQVNYPQGEKNNVKNNLENRKSGINKIWDNKDNIKKIMIYVPIETNNLFVCTFIPEQIINNESIRIILFTILLIISVAIISIHFIIFINKEKQKDKKIIYELAYQDDLTKGYNKNKFILEYNKIKKENRNKYLIAILNIKNFKYVNEIFGREKGDFLLQYIHQTIYHHINNEELVARIKDDIFYLLINKKENSILTIIEEIKKYAKNNVLNYEINLKVGIYEIKKEDENMDINFLIDKAKYAMNQKKEINYYTDTIKEEIKKKNEIERKMQQALEKEEFLIYIQPKYNTQTKKIVGGEALVRWKSENQIVSPNIFIPIFEENNFIKQLDLYVFKKIGLLQKEWMQKKYDVVKISVNQSKKNIYDINYTQKIKQIITENNLPTELLEIELTENIFIEKSELIIKIEKELHQLGISLAMDDFGKGYSSYDLLGKIKIDVLKLDKIFFDDIKTNQKAKIVVRNIIDMTKQLGIITVAEGIETKEQVEFLKEVNCDEIQGYYFSRPISIEEFEKLIQKEKEGKDTEK